MMNYKNTSLLAAMAAVTLVSGFTSNTAHSQYSLIPKSSDNFVVESTPAGAEVWIMGKRAGTTPGTFPTSLVFPAQYKPEDIGLYGRVRLIKEGCESVMLPVSTQAIASKMKVKLNCVAAAPAVVAPAAAPAAQQAPRAIPASPAMAAPVPEVPATAKERLLRLEDLRRDGLINEEEYRSLRKRVLDTL
jgi:hypothetical protein